MIAAVKNYLTNAQDRNANVWEFAVMLVFASISLWAAFTLSVEEFQQLANPNVNLPCNINIVLNCGAVMKTWEAHVFGFPNSFLGLMAEPIVITIAVAGLARVRFPRPFMFTAQIFYALGSLFAYWLFFESVYNIQILCPLCLIVTFSTTFVFEALLRYNVREDNLYLSEKASKAVKKFIAKGYDKFVVAAWLVLLTALVLIKFPNIFG